LLSSFAFALMTTDPIQLLRSLALGSRALPQSQPAQGTSGADFAELLRQAQSGELSSKLPVSVDPDVNVELSDEQLAKLSLAADKAEAAGLRTALVVADGQRLILDVQQRRITGVAEDPSGIVSGVDGVIDLAFSTSQPPRGLFGPLVAPGSESPATRAKPAFAPASSNASLLNLLAQIQNK
jgi:hypothetical protein